VGSFSSEDRLMLEYENVDKFLLWRGLGYGDRELLEGFGNSSRMRYVSKCSL
jgi:hypothetical protein